MRKKIFCLFLILCFILFSCVDADYYKVIEIYNDSSYNLKLVFILNEDEFGYYFTAIEFTAVEIESKSNKTINLYGGYSPPAPDPNKLIERIEFINLDNESVRNIIENNNLFIITKKKPPSHIFMGTGGNRQEETYKLEITDELLESGDI